VPEVAGVRVVWQDGKPAPVPATDSLAEVAVRQGIERLLRARFDDIVAVVDVTDHEAGSDPFYTPEKR